MTTIYTWLSQDVPELSELQTALGALFTWIPIKAAEALNAARDHAGVVLLGGDVSQLATRIGIVRTMAPKLGCVVAVTEAELGHLPAEGLQDADLLVLPATALETRIRLQAAAHLSELKFLIASSAQIDEETRLYTPQYFLKRLGEEMSLAKRHLTPVTCILLGISFYEVLLDSYGYQFVTGMIRQVAEIAQEQVRQEDLVARLGDSEIAILLPRSTEKGALTLAKRMIDKIESVPLYMGDQEEHLHINAGIAAYPAPGDGEMAPDTLVRFARHALHQARCNEHSNIQLLSAMTPHVN